MSDKLTESRRTILKVLGASGSAAAIGGISNVAADDGSQDEEEDYDEDGETIEDGEEVDEDEASDEHVEGDAGLTVEPAEPAATATYEIRVTVGTR